MKMLSNHSGSQPFQKKKKKEKHHTKTTNPPELIDINPTKKKIIPVYHSGEICLAGLFS